MAPVRVRDSLYVRNIVDAARSSNHKHDPHGALGLPPWLPPSEMLVRGWPVTWTGRIRQYRDEPRTEANARASRLPAGQLADLHGSAHPLR